MAGGWGRAASPPLTASRISARLSPSAAPAQGPGKPLQPWGQTPCPEPPPRPSAFLGGPCWPQSNTGCPGLGLPGVHCTQHHVRKLTRLGVRSREPGPEGEAPPALPPEGFHLHSGVCTGTQRPLPVVSSEVRP